MDEIKRIPYCVKVAMNGQALEQVTGKCCERGIPYFVKDDLLVLDESAGYKVMMLATKEEAKVIKGLSGCFMITPDPEEAE